MGREDRCNRSYKVTQLPTLREGYAVAEHKDLLLKIYDQACTTWRELVGVRFKLLAIVPTVSLALLAAVLSTEGLAKGLSTLSRLLIAVFGFLVTLGVFIYDTRNSALHDDLISRARKIEDELGVDTGIFRGRLKAGSIVKHDVATLLIYGASLIAWLAAVILIVTGLAPKP